MNVLTEIFPTACLMFGLFCALLALIGDQAERRRLYRAALMRRVEFGTSRVLIYQEDGKPLTWEEK